MNEQVSSSNPFDPVEAYVRPIRSVLFIDDQFPTFAQLGESGFREADRAKALWQACTDKGLLCDIANTHEWKEDHQKRRLAACELLVLDFHLKDADFQPALDIIATLAESNAPNIVVVYTNDPRPQMVLLRIACWIRGVQSDEGMSESLEEMTEIVEVSLDDIADFLQGGDSWATALQNMISSGTGYTPGEPTELDRVMENQLRRQFSPRAGAKIQPIDRLSHVEQRWLQVGNLFLVVVSKPGHDSTSGEAEIFFESLEAAVRSWDPHWLSCLMAHSRRQVEEGSFRDDDQLLDEPLQRGLLRYINDSSDPLERRSLATVVATDLLSRRFSFAAEDLGAQILKRACDEANQRWSESDCLYLNAFLCSRPFEHHHLQVGTILASKDCVNRQYWLCVTPACDMVPRETDKKMNPWAFELGSVKPILALRLETIDNDGDVRKALGKATMGRYLFFKDRACGSDRPAVTAVFKDTSDPNPSLEQVFVACRGKLQEDGSVQIYRITLESADKPQLSAVTCVPVAQLRAPYAERIVQVVGGHLSRIGVDFVKFK